jgi:2-polyprenyl-3-methyl-5-hydroxy-6-metoxy-1,4-benzoquinol methylase
MSYHKELKKIWSYYPNKSDAFFRSIEIGVVLKNIDKKKYNKVIDIGCGDGFLSRIVFPKQHIVALDNDEANECFIAKKKKLINNYIIQDARKTWRVNKQLNFDLIFSNSVLEHIPRIEKVVYQASLIKSKHDFIFTVPNQNFIYNIFPLFFYKLYILGPFFKKCAEYRSKQLNHYNATNKKFWVKLFNKYGYRLVTFDSYISPSQLQIWNVNVILYKFFKINLIEILKKKLNFKNKKTSKNNCYYFHFKKIKHN